MVTEFRVWAPDASRAEGTPGGQGPPMGGAGEPAWWAAGLREDGAGADYAFRLDGGDPLPDPRSPRQPFGINGVSRTYDHSAFTWTDRSWRGGGRDGGAGVERHRGQ